MFHHTGDQFCSSVGCLWFSNTINVSSCVSFGSLPLVSGLYEVLQALGSNVRGAEAALQLLDK